MPSTTFLVQWLITWLMLAVVFFVAADTIQRYLYEVAVEKLGWRVMAVTPLLAAVLVKWPLPFEDLFLNLFSFGVLAQVALWFVACWLGLRFQWHHAASAGILAVVTIAPIASSSVDSLTKRLVGETPKTAPALPVRTQAGAGAGTSPSTDTSNPPSSPLPGQN